MFQRNTLQIQLQRSSQILAGRPNIGYSCFTSDISNFLVQRTFFVTGSHIFQTIWVTKLFLIQRTMGSYGTTHFSYRWFFQLGANFVLQFVRWNSEVSENLGKLKTDLLYVKVHDGCIFHVFFFPYFKVVLGRQISTCTYILLRYVGI